MPNPSKTKALDQPPGLEPNGTDPVVKNRGRLFLRLIEITILVLVAFFVSAMTEGPTWLARLVEVSPIPVLVLMRQRVRNGARGLEHAFLGLALVLITVFDDGFRGVDTTWSLHIPLSLGIWILVPAPKGRWFWLGLQMLSVVLVNQTNWTPHLDRQAISPAFAWHFHLNLVAVVASCLFMVQHYHRIQADTMEAIELERERAQKASRAKGEFLSHMSHELRTPLNAMQGFAELALQEDGLSPTLRENMRSIRISAEHLTHLVNDILDLARLENGSLVLGAVGFNPSTCTEEIVRLLRSMADEKHLTLRVREANLLPRVVGDRTRWKQILLNLGANAIKYTREGGIDILLSWKPSGPLGGILTVAVADTGPGITASDQERIFLQFERLESDRNTTGTGLGLSISKSLAKAMGGDIVLESVLGRGSTFTLSLPFRVDQASTGDETRTAMAVPLSLSGVRVLLAEDNRTNIRLATQVLQRLQARYDVAENGGIAVDLLERNRYDLVLLDLHMPVLDGFQVAAAIRDPQGAVLRKDTPILALTADAFEDTRARTKAAGIDDYLTKPFRMAELADRILQLVRPET